MTALKMYELDQISSYEAAELAGVSRIEFLQLLRRHQVPPFEWLDETGAPTRPVGELSDVEVLRLANLQMPAWQSQRLQELLDKQRESQLTADEQSELAHLLHVSAPELQGSVVYFYRPNQSLMGALPLSTLNPGWVCGHYRIPGGLKKMAERLARLAAHSRPAPRPKRSKPTLWELSGWQAPVVCAPLGLVERFYVMPNMRCDPNIWMNDEVTLVARRDIEPGEELTADYAMWEADEDWMAPWQCHCGSRGCRRVITGRDWRRKELQGRYSQHFSPFMNERIRKLIDQKQVG